MKGSADGFCGVPLRCPLSRPLHNASGFRGYSDQLQSRTSAAQEALILLRLMQFKSKSTPLHPNQYAHLVAVLHGKPLLRLRQRLLQARLPRRRRRRRCLHLLQPAGRMQAAL